MGTGAFLIPPQAMLRRSFSGENVSSMLFPMALSKGSSLPAARVTAVRRPLMRAPRVTRDGEIVQRRAEAIIFCKFGLCKCL